jgi:hypothetical protein
VARRKKTKAAPKAPVEKAEPKAETKPSSRFETFEWRGFTRYRCSECPFDAGSEEEVYLHFHKNHLSPKRQVEVDTGLVSPSGDKIVKIEEADNGKSSTDAG